MVNHHVEDSMVLPSSSTVGVKNFITYVCFKYEDTTAVNLKWIYFYFFLLKIDENTQSSASPQEFLHMGVSLTL